MKTVVAVDDDDLSLGILEELLWDKGFNVILISDPSELIKYMESVPNDVDLFLLDIQMPGQNGFDVLKYLRYSDEKFNDAPVITVSAFATKDYQEKALSLGAIAYVCKPFDEVDLMSQINSHI